MPVPKRAPSRILKHIALLRLALVLLLCTSCSTYRPADTQNLCTIFAGKTAWYKHAKASNKRWGTPIGVMMAIVNQESSFRHNVRPKRRWFLFIPLPRRSSAYGYAQAQDAAWSDYRKITGNKGHDRDNFRHAINFVGWYTDTSQKRLGISKWDPYSQYLAYHEGWGGFKSRSFDKKPSLLKVASKVKRQAETYNAQLKGCNTALDKKIDGWF